MMTEEQKHAEAELEKTLGTLSEEELDMLAGGKVTDDVKKFFKSEKGKEVMKWTDIVAGTAVGVGAAVYTTARLVSSYKKRHTINDKHNNNGYASPLNDTQTENKRDNPTEMDNNVNEARNFLGLNENTDSLFT